MAFIYNKNIAEDTKTGTVIRMGGAPTGDASIPYKFKKGSFVCGINIYFQFEWYNVEINRITEKYRRGVSAYILEPSIMFDFLYSWENWGGISNITSQERVARDAFINAVIAWEHAAPRHPDRLPPAFVLSARIEAAYAEFRSLVQAGIWVYLTRGEELLKEIPGYRLEFVQRRCDLPMWDAAK